MRDTYHLNYNGLGNTDCTLGFMTETITLNTMAPVSSQASHSCMDANGSRAPKEADREDKTRPSFRRKLWIYTNYDCNLRCSYCVARSGPNVPRRALGLLTVQQLVDESVMLGYEELYFTGGEPFVLKDIYEMLAYASARLKTSVLTNGMLLSGPRLEQLVAVANTNLMLQVSLDGGVPEHHDPYRGAGTWQRTVDGIQNLLAEGLRVRLSTTETPANAGHLHMICELHRKWGIADSDHFVRPLARRGYSRQGLEVDMNSLIPEMTVNLDGVFWHPLSTDADMQVSKHIFPLQASLERIQAQLDAVGDSGHAALRAFT